MSRLSFLPAPVRGAPTRVLLPPAMRAEAWWSLPRAFRICTVKMGVEGAGMPRRSAAAVPVAP
ncbi:MAG TPA: hypothetical protein VHG08_06445 [Longimicrobium sp.]|nr:hypothetical protein [Longimicrobium sp.]